MQFSLSPDIKDTWYEEFYTGRLRVVNGIAETDNQDWINTLAFRGYVPYVETAPVREEAVEAVVKQDKPKSPPRINAKV